MNHKKGNFPCLECKENWTSWSDYNLHSSLNWRSGPRTRRVRKRGDNRKEEGRRRQLSDKAGEVSLNCPQNSSSKSKIFFKFILIWTNFVLKQPVDWKINVSTVVAIWTFCIFNFNDWLETTNCLHWSCSLDLSGNNVRKKTFL